MKDPKEMLELYALGGLSAEEKEALFAAALDNQELFNRLAEEEPLRSALEQPENRAAVLAALREPAPTWYERLLRVLRQPRNLALSAGALAAVAGAVVFGVLSLHRSEFNISLDPTQGPALSMLSVEAPEANAASQSQLIRLFSLALQEPVPAQLGLNKTGRSPQYRIGDGIRFGFLVQNGGRCLLLDRLENGAPVQVFPNRFTTEATATAGQTLMVPPNGQGNLSVNGPPGKHHVRLIVVPADVTLDLSSPDSWSRRATVIEREYTVLAGGQ